MEKQLDRLRKEAPPGTTAGSTEDRLAKLKEDAAALTNTTETMTQTLDGKKNGAPSAKTVFVLRFSSFSFQLRQTAFMFTRSEIVNVVFPKIS